MILINIWVATLSIVLMVRGVGKVLEDKLDKIKEELENKNKKATKID